MTLVGDDGLLPIALTTTTLPSAGSLMASLAMSRILSVVAMQVPPNLWTCHWGPRGHPSALAALTVLEGAARGMMDDLGRTVVWIKLDASDC